MLQEAGRRLETAEDRINKLKTEIERLQDRVVRAEKWLQLIQKEIEEKLIAQPPVRNR
jgi:predicted  nucleic acid-binding Zn-ribbon protein